MQSKWTVSLLLLFTFSTQALHGQAPASGSKPEPDVIIFVNGERMLGHLEKVTGSSVVFTSDMVGTVSVDWSKIRELRSSQKFAVIPKTTKLHGSRDANTIPQGTLAMTDQKLQVNTGPGARAQTMPVGNVGNVVDEASFQEAFRRLSWTEGWKGSATAGLSLTEATQTSHGFTASVNFVRAVPNVNWLDLRSRTIFDYNQAYASTSTPGSPTIKTSLFHIDAEHDWYRSARLYTFIGAAFDHNFSQGLALQQTYGGGVGVVLFKTDIQEFDVKASLDYINQRFQISTLNKNLIGSIFGESYSERFAHGILFNEQAGVTTAWNDRSAYSVFASAGLTLPVYHRLGLTLGALDNYLNDSPPGFKKNSFQFTLGATYSFQ
jgi:Protein of unknown function, DUF481